MSKGVYTIFPTIVILIYLLDCRCSGACDFQVKAWKTFATLFPLHAKTLGSGLAENILIDTHLKYKYPSNSSDYFMRAAGVLGKQFICNYYSVNSLVAKSKSLPISVRNELKRVSPVVIFCPVPIAAHSLSDANKSFTHLSLSLNPDDPRPSPYDYLVYNPRNLDAIQGLLLYILYCTYICSESCTMLIIL